MLCANREVVGRIYLLCGNSEVAHMCTYHVVRGVLCTYCVVSLIVLSCTLICSVQDSFYMLGKAHMPHLSGGGYLSGGMSMGLWIILQNIISWLLIFLASSDSHSALQAVVASL